MKRFSLIAFLLILSGCAEPLYESDYPLYRQYKYWESADSDWHEADNFRILVYKTVEEQNTTLQLIPQRKGLPSTEKGYISAAQKAAFNIMTVSCADSSFVIRPSKAPPGGRVIDRFFFQNKDLSVGVTFSCRSGKPDADVLSAEQQKWSLAQRRWDKINGVQAFVDTLPVSNNGLHQIRIRLFGGNEADNKKLARRIIQDTCPNVNFRILFDNPGFDMVPAGRLPEVVCDKNVRIYGFTCQP